MSGTTENRSHTLFYLCCPIADRVIVTIGHAVDREDYERQLMKRNEELNSFMLAHSIISRERIRMMYGDYFTFNCSERAIEFIACHLQESIAGKFSQNILDIAVHTVCRSRAWFAIPEKDMCILESIFYSTCKFVHGAAI